MRCISYHVVQNHGKSPAPLEPGWGDIDQPGFKKHGNSENTL